MLNNGLSHQYLIDNSLRKNSILQQLREETLSLGLPPMLLSPEIGQLLQLLIKISNTKKILEIGTFTGYSTLAMAQALPEDGHILALDINPEWNKIGLPYWEKANVAHKIKLRHGSAVDYLPQLQQAQQFFDFIFIDADKCNYPFYYQHSLTLLQSGGLICCDNVLFKGHVANKNINNGSVRGIRSLNNMVFDDPSVDISMLPIGDGLTIIRKK